MKYSQLKLRLPTYYRAAIVGWGMRIVSGILHIIAVAYLLQYLGVDLYAVFAVIIGLQGWFGLAEFGLGSSLQNYFSEARLQQLNLHKILSNANLLILLLFVSSSLIFLFSAPWLQHLLFHRMAATIYASSATAFFWAGILFLATTTFGVAYRVWFAMHKGCSVYWLQGVGQICAVSAIIMLKYMHLTNVSIQLVIMLWLIPPLITALICYFKIFPFKKLIAYFDWAVIKIIMMRGIKFWGCAITAALVLMIDYIIMTQTLRPAEITIYNILFKGFDFVFFIYNAVLSVMWPELTELFAQGKWRHADKIVRKNIIIGVGLVAICTLLVLVVRTPIMLLIAPKMGLTLPVSGIILFGLYYIIRVWTDTYAVVLQSQNYLRIFWIITPLQAVISAAGMYYLSLLFGVNGILIGLIIAFLLTASWMLPLAYKQKKYQHAITN